MNSSIPTSQAIWAASGDVRQLWSIVVLLVVVGVAMAMLAVAVFKVTRPDRELLAPLEVMASRKWRRADPVWQRRQLDSVRPPGAEPLRPAPALPVPLDGFDAGPDASGFDDLGAEPDEGVDAALTELPGGEVFDSDPTPPSVEVPVIVADAASDDVTLAQLGVDWSPPAPEDLSVPADAPVLDADDAADDDAAGTVG